MASTPERVHPAAAPLRPRVRATRRTGTSTRSSSSPTARSSRASCRPRRASTARSASAARAAPRSAARAACASTASRASPATPTWTRPRPQARGRRHRGRADGQHARHQGPDRRHGRGPLEEDPARHAVAHQQGADPRARVRRPARVDDRRHAVDGLHPVRRLRLGLPVDGGRPAVRRPRRAGQGLPLRRRPARRRAVRAPQGPRRGPARHLRLHPLLQVHRGVPEGRRADEPDHAPAPPRRQRPRHRRPQQRPPPRAWRSSRTSAATACCTRPTCCPTPTAASSIRARCPSCWTRCRSITRALLRRKVTPKGALVHSHKAPKDVKAIYEAVEGREERVELNLYITGYDEDLEGAPTPAVAAGGDGATPGAEPGQPGQSPEGSPTR